MPFSFQKKPNTDYSQVDSPTNPSFVNRVEEALSWKEAEKQLNEEIEVKKQRNAYRGFSDSDTSITQRIAKATFQPENSSAYRTQQVLEAKLKQQEAQLKEDLARNIQYLKDMKGYLS